MHRSGGCEDSDSGLTKAVQPAKHSFFEDKEEEESSNAVVEFETDFTREVNLFLCSLTPTTFSSVLKMV